MRMREKLTNYSFTITWVEGKSHYVADALSRAPVFTEEEEEIPTDSAIACLQVTDTGSLSSITSNIDKDYLALTELSSALCQQAIQQGDIKILLTSSLSPIMANQISLC